MKKLWVVFLSLMLVLSVTLPLTTSVQAATISDVSTKDSKYKAINWAIDNKIMALYTGNKFAMQGNVSEAQALLMFARLDANYIHSYATDMTYNYYTDLHMPLEGSYSKAKRARLMTRGEFAVLFAAMKGYDLSEVQAVQYLYLQEVTTGKTGKRTYKDFAPKDNLTRGDVAVFLYRAMQKGKLRVDGFLGPLTGKDNKKITLPINFVGEEGGAVPVKPGTPGKNDPSANEQQSIQAVQSIKVEKNTLTANGQDSTLINIKLKDSNGNNIPYTKSLKFRVTSEYFDWKCNCAGRAGSEVLQKATAVTSPNGTPTSYVYSDGPDVSFHFQAPRVTKSLKDYIILELVDETDSNYSTYKNKQIRIPVEYIPQPELRVSYEVFDATVGDYVGGDKNTPPKVATPIPGVPQGPMKIIGINPDKKQFTREVSAVDAPYRTVPYEHAYVSLAGYKISEQMFEQIVDNYLREGGKELTVQYTTDANGFPMYDLPFALIPSSYTAPLANAPQSYAVLLYLIDLLPSSINNFSMAYYDSVKTAELIARSIPANMLNVAPLLQYRSKINGLYALAQLADQTLLDEQEASRPENMPSYTKVIVEILAPGGQLITNYKGAVEITYGGKTYTETFANNGGKAIKYIEGLKYGTSDVKVKLVNLNQDTRYQKVLVGLDKQETKKKILVRTPISDMVCTLDLEAAFLIDNSGSMNAADPNNILNDSVVQFVDSVDSLVSSSTGFTTKANTDIKGTPATVKGYVNYEKPYDASERRGATRLLTGIKQAGSQFDSDASDRSVKRIIFMISDGKTNENAKTLVQAAEAEGAQIYTISMGEADQNLMKNISSATGGKHYHISNSDYINTIVNTVLQSLCGGSASCPITDGFEKAQVTILRQSIYIEAIAHCQNVAEVDVKFYSVSGSFDLDLKYIGENMFELEYALSKIKNFNIYKEVEFFAYDSNGKLLTSQIIEL